MISDLTQGEHYHQRQIAGETWSEIASDVGSTREQVRGAARRYRRENGIDMNEHNPALKKFIEQQKPTVPALDSGADKVRRVLTEYLGTTAMIPGLTAAPVDRRKVIVLADLHGSPSPDILKAIIDEQPDEIVIAGDLLDSAQSSAWGKEIGGSDRQLTIRQEMTNVRAFIEMLLIETRATVHVMRGNHDQWSMRTASQLLPPHLLEFFRDPFDVLLEGLPVERVHRVRTVWEFHHPDKTRSDLGESEFMFVMGDVLISHCNFVGANTGDAVKKLGLWADKWRGTLELQGISVFIQAHVHNVCLIEADGGNRVLIEPGAACEPRQEAYKVSYQAKWKAMSLGCVTFDQVKSEGKWQTDFSSIRLVRPRRELSAV
jgi:predicted phosphodiesterase